MRRTAILVALLVSVAVFPPLAAQGSARIVAIGDIHGSIDGFKSILKAAGLADASGKWTGGRAQLIQTGDYTDRGEGTRAVLDLLMTLESQAKAAGGRAFALLGNHEVMNLIGDTRDVTPAIFATFADANSEKRRLQAWDDYLKLAAGKKSKGEPVPAVYSQTQEVWMAARPLGYVEYKEAFAPRGKYGSWLRGKPIVIIVNGNIFMHAGIPPLNPPVKIDDLNNQTRDEIRKLDQFLERLIGLKLATRDFSLQDTLQVAFNEIARANALIAAAKVDGTELERDRLNIPMLMDAQEIAKVDSWLVVNPEGALWYRGLATEPDNLSGAPFAELLTKYGARRFITGHTPQANRSVNIRFGGRAVLIDTGMLTNYYKGRASALEINGDKLTAIYEDGRTTLQ